MHLEGPWLSKAGKKKGKIKFRNADEARKARELDASWTELQKKWGVEQEERKRSRALQAETLKYSLTVPEERSTKHIPSLSTGGVAVSKPTMYYTGTKMKGIGTLHKSNAVPVFSDEEAHDIARMRRG